MFGKEQFEWIQQSLTDAAEDPDIKGVVITLSFEWKAAKIFDMERTLYEKQEIAALILRLGFNTPKLDKFLVMISGDAHMLAYDSGEHNGYGNFPIFQCSSLDSRGSCKANGWTSSPSMAREQFCRFEITQHPTNPARSCLKAEGFNMKNQLFEFSTCQSDFYQERLRSVKNLQAAYLTDENYQDFEWYNKDPADQNEIFIENIDKMIREAGK